MATIRQRPGWSTPPLSRALHRRLARQRARIAATLTLDPSTQTWRSSAPPYPDYPLDQVAAYIAWRQTPSPGGHTLPRIDQALEEIEGALFGAWGVYRCVNRNASDAELRHELTALRGYAGDLAARLWDCSGSTRGLIEAMLPRGKQILESGAQTDAELRAAIDTALAILPKPRRGRPAGSRDHATRYLALRLADVYMAWTERRPTRILDPYSGQEYGPFQDFVEAVIAVVPRRLRTYLDAPPGTAVAKSPQSLVRIAVDLYRERSRASVG